MLFYQNTFLFSFGQAKQKGLFGGGGGGGGGYSRRSSSAMSEDILREAAGSTLTMGIIGCLPDNVQQVRSSVFLCVFLFR